MQCPYCQYTLQPGAPECPACKITFPRTSTLLGALPRLAPVVADTTHSLSASDQARIKLRIMEMQRRFPQLVVQVVVHHYPNDHPFAMHAFWLFNAGSFASDSRRGADNHAVMITLDPARSESAIIPGYALENLLTPEALGHLLDLAGPSWEETRWADGIFRVLNGLDQLLESVATPDGPALPIDGEY